MHINIRPAVFEDLAELKNIFALIVQDMHRQGIKIWNDFYPYEEFSYDLSDGFLYIIEKDCQIVGAFALCPDEIGGDSLQWEDSSAAALYFRRLGIRPDCSRQGIASFAVAEALKIAKNKGFSYVRLTVAEENTPAVFLYQKNNFVKAKGEFKEFSPSLNKTITEIGFEYKLR